VDTLDGIECAARAVLEPHSVMQALAAEYRGLATSMTRAEIADVYRCVYEDQRYFDATYGDLKDIGGHDRNAGRPTVTTARHPDL
jgi:hypothetical protein